MQRSEEGSIAIYTMLSGLAKHSRKIVPARDRKSQPMSGHPGFIADLNELQFRKNCCQTGP